MLSRRVAVKVLRSEFTGDPTFLARFRAEAQHAALVTHRHIAALYDYGELDDAQTGERLAFLVMELVDGESLADLLARERRLPAPRTLAILRQAADALAAAHAAGLVHRDVKPGNVLVAADGSVKLTDFGIAVSASSLPLTQTGQVVGTAHYLSPEQAEGNRAGAASDVYALGLVGYECLAGRRAFDGESSVQIALSHLRDNPDPLPDDVPEQVQVLIRRATARDPAKRLPDGGAFRDAIDDVLAGRPLAPPAPDTAPLPPVRPPVSPAGRGRRRARAVVPLAALLLGAGLGVGALQLALDPAPSPAAQEAGAADTVQVVAADHLGRPVAEVEAALGRLGLRVERVADDAADGAAGTVTGLGPTGALERGTLVRVSYATGTSDVDGPAVGEVSSEAPASSPPAPVAATAPPLVEAPAPPAAASSPEPTVAEPPPAPANGNAGGKANGNGKSNGNGKGNPGRGKG